MELDVKRPIRLVPSYSLTGDLVSFKRCALQYRFSNLSALPPSRPVQMWFGEFVHGVMEAAFALWKSGKAPPLPWDCTMTPYRGQAPAGRPAHDLGTIGEMIEGALERQQKTPRNEDARNSGYERIKVAVNRLGPHLFPLIAEAEQRVIGTRVFPPPASGPSLRADRYELTGVIDVLTHVELASIPHSNVIKAAVQAACPTLTGNFEVIVDYKGSRRPPTNHEYWTWGDWQVQTYAWLRGRQPGALPVVAGILIYVNELSPNSGDLSSLKSQMKSGTTDVVPVPGTPDHYFLSAWKPGNATDGLSEAFRMARAIRVIPIDAKSIKNATDSFDQVVQEIEVNVANEAIVGNIKKVWAPTCSDEETCVACDLRTHCPKPAGSATFGPPSAPFAP
ncbi:MAG TPA: PD-(D/E)XK nuclease family protein [Usitatibacter sp.]|nr:PD-(D/E)XK nuclease family protein [Usitatibacter sp.]